MGDESPRAAEVSDLGDVMDKLDVDDVEADDTVADDDDTSPRGSSTTSLDQRSSSASGGSDSKSGACVDDLAEEVQDGGVTQTDDASSDGPTSGASGSGKKSGSTKDKNPLRFLKKLVNKGEKDKNKTNAASGPSDLERLLEDIKVDALPQVFVTKYLGSRTCKGLWGIRSTRAPVEEMIQDVKKLEEGQEIPLIQLRISPKGIHVREHSANRCRTQTVDKELIPIEFISYGVQDIKYTRVFSFILVREMSSRSKKLECHAYVCDSTVSARRLALSLSLAFKQYAASLDGKNFRFQVDLRPAEELEQDLQTPARDGDIEV